MKRSALLLAVALIAAVPADAQTLSRETVGHMVDALESVAAADGKAAVADPAAVHSSAALQDAAHRLKFSTAEWEDRHRAIIAAYRTMEDSAAASSKPKSKRGIFGRILSADNISAAGSAALFGGGVKAVAVDAATDGAAAALGEDNFAGSAVATAGSSVAYGGRAELGMAVGQLAVDGAAGLISGEANGDEPGSSKPAAAAAAAPAIAKSDLRAVKPYISRLRALLGAASQ